MYKRAWVQGICRPAIVIIVATLVLCFSLRLEALASGRDRFPFGFEETGRARMPFLCIVGPYARHHCKRYRPLLRYCFQHSESQVVFASGLEGFRSCPSLFVRSRSSMWWSQAVSTVVPLLTIAYCPRQRFRPLSLSVVSIVVAFDSQGRKSCSRAVSCSQAVSTARDADLAMCG